MLRIVFFFLIDLYNASVYDSTSTNVSFVFGITAAFPEAEESYQSFYDRLLLNELRPSTDTSLYFRMYYTGFTFPMMFFSIKIPTFYVKELVFRGEIKNLTFQVSYRYDINREMTPIKEEKDSEMMKVSF